MSVSSQVGQLKSRRQRTTSEVARIDTLAPANPSADNATGVGEQPGFHCCLTPTSHCATKLPLTSQVFEPLNWPNTDAVAFTFTDSVTVAYARSRVCRKHGTAGKWVLHQPGAGRFLVFAALWRAVCRSGSPVHLGATA